MQERNDIFNGGGKKAFNVPEGYFEGLKARLGDIPEQGMTLSLTQRLKPYLALAACFATLLIAGNAALKGTTGGAAGDEYSEIAYAYLSQTIQAEEYLQSDFAERDTITDEDVINYLIDSGASAELIEYTGLIAQK